jgi:protocatechuate 3,4-dioxygenase beta subunit
MYFPDDPLNASDRLLNAALRPDLLIAKPVSSEYGYGHRVLNFDIVLSRG